ncbi:MAG: MmcQ/YjbR family DNA-binding protein [Phenylobacterium sp.]
MSLSPHVAAVVAVIEARPGAMGDSVPSAPGVTLYKVMGKMFAILATRRTPYVILKCDPHLAEVLREQYAGVSHRSHLDRRFWISVDLDGDVPADEIARAVAHSYDQVCDKLTKKQKAELAALAI